MFCYRQLHRTGEPVREENTLVIPPRAEFFRVEGHRYNDIRLIEGRRIGEQSTVSEPDGRADLRTVPVFELVYDAFYARCFTERPVGCYGLDTDPAPQLAGTAIPFVYMGTGMGQMVPTSGADMLFAVHQRQITPRTGLGEKEGGEIVEVPGDAHGQSSC